MMTGPIEPAGVVALVGSAGGLDAVTQILDALPPDFPGAVVTLLHQRPGGPSRLAELLDRGCSLPVERAEDGARLRAGRVLVVPNATHLLVADGHVRLIASGTAPPSRPSADLLLATLAVAYGPRAIAVVLSGYGHDGATGATAVHAFGGTVVAADADSSQVFGMPGAVIDREQITDRVLPVSEIPRALLELLDGLGRE
jgi:two-component system chemotaxis response regulator CheB